MKVLISYSGGKDSQACLIWAVKEYGVEKCEAVFCDTGWENPQTYDHIQQTCKDLGVPLVVVKSKKYDGFIDLARKKKRFPSTKARFCTSELKVIPSIDYVLNHTENIIVVEGIRKAESFSRSLMQPACTYFKSYFEPNAKGKTQDYRKKDVLAWCEKYNADRIRPIFEWDAQRVIDYIRDNGQQPNPLYYQGFTRVGCFPCIMSRHGHVKRIIDNFPEQWETLKKHEADLKQTFFPPDYIPKWAQTGTANDGNRVCTAEDVEKYLKARNATGDMFEEDTPSCMSAYHLCE